MPDAPDTLTLTEHHYDDVRGASADVRVVISETTAGDRCSQRARALRDRLTRRTFDDDEVTLQDVAFSAWSWVGVLLLVVTPVVAFLVRHEVPPALGAAGVSALLYLLLRAGKVGTVTATLVVRCASTTRVGVAVDEALAAGAEVSGIQWRHDLADATPSDWALRCVERAGDRAARLAEALGARIEGVHAYHEEQVLPPTTYTVAPAEAVAERRRMAAAGVAESLGGLQPSTQRAGLRVTITYRLAPTGRAWS